MSKYICIFLAIISLKLTASETIIYEKKIHADSIDSLCVSDEKIYTASFDGSIKRTIGDESKIIGKHKDWVRKVICVDSNIISASNDGTIAIWNGLKKTRSVQAHSWWVTDIALSDDKLISVSLDETVKVWSYPELKLLYSHKIYGSNKHYSVAINNGKAFIGSTHGFMSILDMENFNWLMQSKVVSGYYSIPLSVTKSDKHVYFGSSDGFITKVMTSAPFKIDRKKISEFPVKALVYNQGLLYIGDRKGVLRKVNTEKLNKPYVINHLPQAISSLAISNNFIYAGYDNGYIRIFNKKAKIPATNRIKVMKNKTQ